MSTKYTFSIENDFPNKKVVPSRLLREIRASAIVTAADHVNTSGDDCDVWFKDSLSQGDSNTLDGLISSHSGEAELDDQESAKYNSMTFVVLAEGVSPGNNKSMISIMNDEPSNIVRIEGIQFYQAGTTAQTGTTIVFSFREIGSHTNGNTLSASSMDSLDLLPSLITCKTGANTSTKQRYFGRRILSNNEIVSDATINYEEVHNSIYQTGYTASRPFMSCKSITLRNGEGLSIKCDTNTTILSWDIIVTFTVE